MSSKDVLLYFGTEEAKVTAGQDADCQVKLKKDCQIYNISADAKELKTACESDGNAYIFMGADSSVSTNQATPDNYQLANITSGTKIIRGNGGKLVQSTDDNKTLTTEGGQIKLFNVTGCRMRAGILCMGRLLKRRKKIQQWRAHTNQSRKGKNCFLSSKGR